MTTHQQLYITTDEAPTAARTRQQDESSPETLKLSLLKFIDKLWEGVVDRFKHNNNLADSTTCWSEAPAESIFSTWQFVIDHRASLTTLHTEALCRIIRDGPKPATKSAEILMSRAANNWDAQCGLRFTTRNWQAGFTSQIVEKLMK